MRSSSNNDSNPVYDIKYNVNEMSNVLKLFAFVPSLLIGFILPVVLIVTNAIIFSDFRKSTKQTLNRYNLKSNESSNLTNKKDQLIDKSVEICGDNTRAVNLIFSSKKNLTRLVLSINTLFIFSNILCPIYVFALFMVGSSSIYTDLILIIFSILVLISHNLGFLVYYTFDKPFKETTRSYFKSAFLRFKIK